MCADHLRKCCVYQHGDLYNCEVCIDIEKEEEIRMIAVRADKIKINYNTNQKMFTIQFFYSAMRVAECSVNKVFLYDLTKDNKVQLPSLDVEWPYDDIYVDEV